MSRPLTIQPSSRRNRASAGTITARLGAAVLLQPLVLHSSNAVHEPAPQLPGWRRGAAPDPRFGTPVELLRSDLRRVLDLGMIGEALAGEGVVPEQAPPRFLEIEPAGALGDEHGMRAGMGRQPL